MDIEDILSTQARQCPTARHLPRNVELAQHGCIYLALQIPILVTACYIYCLHTAFTNGLHCQYNSIAQLISQEHVLFLKNTPIFLELRARLCYTRYIQDQR